MSRGYDCCMSCKWRNNNPYESCIDCLNGDGFSFDYKDYNNEDYDYDYEDDKRMNEANKSILIIDTPKNCSECCCGYDSYGELTLCTVKLKSTTEYCRDNIKPDWCPLSPLPLHKNISHYIQREDAKSMTHRVMAIHDTGYNDCLNDIMKGETYE